MTGGIVAITELNPNTARKGGSMPVPLTLHDIPLVERPRERLREHGPSTLSSAEILALILGRGTKGLPVMYLSQQILGRFGSLKAVSEASLDELCIVPGLGLAKAAQLQACMEIGRRVSAEVTANGKTKVTQPSDVARLVRGKLEHRQREHYFLLSLDSRSQLIGIDRVSSGTLDAALVHPRETFETAIGRHAAKIIISHNHPSGDPTPSDDDLAVTKRLVMAGRVLGISLIDHVIVTEGGHFSLQEHGQI
jgi:DNA repair protein RadC